MNAIKWLWRRAWSNLIKPATEESRPFKHDVFLSYSRKDMDFVLLLQKALIRYRPPKGLAAETGTLRVFRDQSDLVGNDLSQALEGNLRQSSKLIVICSQASCASPYVELEIRKFAQLRGKDNIIPLLYASQDGIGDAKDIPLDHLFPKELTTLFELPLAENYVGFNAKKNRIRSGKFYWPWIGLLSRIYDKEKAAIERRERRRQVAALRIWATAGVVLVASLSALTVWAFLERSEAERHSMVALARQLAAQSVEDSARDLGLALLLSVQAVKISASSETRTALARNLHLRGPLKQFLNGHGDTIWSAAFSTDGQLLATASQDESIIVWDVHSGAEKGRRKFGDDLRQRDRNGIRSVAFSPDGKTLAFGDELRFVGFWDWAADKLVKQPGHEGTVRSVAYSPDGTTLVSAGNDGQLILWDALKHEKLGILGDPPSATGKSAPVVSVRFSPDGKSIASGSQDGTLKVCESGLRSLQCQVKQAHAKGILAIAFSPDGRTLVSGGGDGKVISWDLHANMKPEQLPSHEDSVQALAFVRNGDLLASAGQNRTILVYDLASGKLTHRLPGHEAAVWALASHGNLLASASGLDKKVILWNLAADAPRIELGEHKGAVREVAFSLDGGRISSVDWNGWLMVRNATTGAVQSNVPAHGGGSIYRVAYSPDGATWATSGEDGQIILWDSKTHAQRMRLPKVHSHPVRAMAFSPNGKYLASGDRYGKIVLWTASTGAVLAQPQIGHSANSAVYGLAFSRDEKMLVSAGFDGNVMVRDPLSGEPVASLIPPPSKQDPKQELSFRAVAISPDSKTVAAGDVKGKIFLWDLATSQKRSLFHVSGVEGLAYAPDGKTLISVGGDRTATLWDAASAQMYAQLKGHREIAYSVAFNPKNPFQIATGSLDKTVRLWDIKSQDWMKNACQTANRNLTCAEWRTFVGEVRPYQLSCEDKPPPPDAETGACIADPRAGR